MQEILDVAIPAVVLIPIILLSVAVWIGVNYNAKSSVVRRAEFQRLQRLAAEEHERAEREYEREYSQQRQGDYRRRESGENDYRNPAQPQPQPQQDGWRQLPEAEIRRRKQAEEEEYHKRQAEADFHHRRMQDEADERRRRELAAEDELIKKRKAEERERERRIAEIEAHIRREEEEERRRKLAEDEANRKRQQEEEARQHHEVGNKDVYPVSNLHCLVCKNPTKRRCSRCKSVFYWYVVGSLILRNLSIVSFMYLCVMVDHFSLQGFGLIANWYNPCRKFTNTDLVNTYNGRTIP